MILLALGFVAGIALSVVVNLVIKIHEDFTKEK